MRVLILGGAGMLGHKLLQHLRARHDTWVTLRGAPPRGGAASLYDPARTLTGVEATRFDTVVGAFAAARPDAVINCVGIIKQLAAARDPLASITLNALFPHQLARLCAAAGARLVHFSTDCVFSGRKGRYDPDDVSDAEDLYGRTKYLGELHDPHCVTIRSSIIGRELWSASGLVEWFLANRGGRVRGYSRAIYTGFSTLAMARIVTDVLERHTELAGIQQVASDPIDKFELLGLLRDTYALPVQIDPHPDVAIDRSLDGSRFRQATGFVPPPWPAMVREMADDPTPYEQWRVSA